MDEVNLNRKKERKEKNEKNILCCTNQRRRPREERGVGGAQAIVYVYIEQRCAKRKPLWRRGEAREAATAGPCAHVCGVHHCARTQTKRKRSPTRTHAASINVPSAKFIVTTQCLPPGPPPLAPFTHKKKQRPPAHFLPRKKTLNETVLPVAVAVVAAATCNCNC
jgi:hypothetical protein